MVYRPELPILDLSNLVSGSVMITSAVVVIIKVSQGSKNKFAYVLLSLTVVMGISKIGFAFIEAYRMQV